MRGRPDALGILVFILLLLGTCWLATGTVFQPPTSRPMVTFRFDQERPATFLVTPGTTAVRVVSLVERRPADRGPWGWSSMYQLELVWLDAAKKAIDDRVRCP